LKKYHLATLAPKGDSFISVNVIWGILMSLQPPFYPTEAEKKGKGPFFL
jgi:hypothetical protein